MKNTSQLFITGIQRSAVIIISCVIIYSLMVYISLMPVEAKPTIVQDTIPKSTDQTLRKHIKRLYNDDDIKRAHAAYAIGEMGDDASPAIPFLIEMLNEWDMAHEMWNPPEPKTSPGKEAADALKKIGAKAIAALIDLLRDTNKNELTRTAAAQLLGEMNNPRAVDALISVLHDSVWDSPWGIQQNEREFRTVDPLMALLDDTSSSSLQMIVRQSLVLLTGKDFAHDKKAWRYWWVRNKGPLKVSIATRKDATRTIPDIVSWGVPTEILFTIENKTDDYVIIRECLFEDQLPDIFNWYGSVRGTLEFDGLHDAWDYYENTQTVTEPLFVKGLIFPHEKIDITPWLDLKDTLLTVTLSFNHLREHDILKHVYFNTGIKGAAHRFEHITDIRTYVERFERGFAVIPRLHIMPDLEIFPLSEQKITMDIELNEKSFGIEDALERVDTDIIDFVFWETERGWVLKGVDKTFLVRENGVLELPMIDLNAFIIIAEQFVEVDVVLPLMGYEVFNPRWPYVDIKGTFNPGLTPIRADNILRLLLQAKKKEDSVGVMTVAVNGAEEKYCIVVGKYDEAKRRKGIH